MHDLKTKIEAILFFKNEPVTLGDLTKWLKADKEEVRGALRELSKDIEKRGIVLITNGEEVGLGTNPKLSSLIEEIQKEEFSRDLGKAGLETLAIILYKGPISRREIDYIRGVNSGFILRTLLIRGLIERSESVAGERSFSYRPTLELLKHLGVKEIEDLPEYKDAWEKISSFSQGIDDAKEEVV